MRHDNFSTLFRVLAKNEYVDGLKYVMIFSFNLISKQAQSRAKALVVSQVVHLMDLGIVRNKSFLDLAFDLLEVSPPIE